MSAAMLWSPKAQKPAGMALRGQPWRSSQQWSMPYENVTMMSWSWQLAGSRTGAASPPRWPLALRRPRGHAVLRRSRVTRSQAAKAKIVAAGGDDTVRTRVFDIVRRLDWLAPYAGRALQNAFSRRWHGREADLENSLPAEVMRYQHAAERNDVDTSEVFAGEGVDLIH
jgi:hypothetical protein